MPSSLASTLPIVVVVVLLASCCCCCCSGFRLPEFQCDQTNREYGHSRRFPYLVAISYKSKLIGAGAIVSKHHVLTTASTIFFESELYDGELRPPPLNVHSDLKGGRWDEAGQVHEVVDSRLAKGYEAHTERDRDSHGRVYMSTLKSDLAVLRIQGNFEWGKRVRAIGMVEDDDDDDEDNEDDNEDDEGDSSSSSESFLGAAVTIPTWDADGRGNNTRMFVYSGVTVAEAGRCERCTFDRYGVNLDDAEGWCVDKCDGDDQRYLNGSPVVIGDKLVGVIAGPMGMCSLHSAYVMDVRAKLEMINDFIDEDPDVDACDAEW